MMGLSFLSPWRLLLLVGVLALAIVYVVFQRRGMGERDGRGCGYVHHAQELVADVLHELGRLT